MDIYQRQVADWAGIDRGEVSRYEAGKQVSEKIKASCQLFRAQWGEAK